MHFKIVQDLHKLFQDTYLILIFFNIAWLFILLLITCIYSPL